MIGIFKRKKTDEVEHKINHKFNQIENQVATSFGNVRQDTSQIFQWLKYFYYKTHEQEKTILSLQNELSLMPKSHEEIRQIIDKHYAFENVIRKVRDMEERLDRHAKEKPVVDLTEVHKRIDRVALAHAPILEKVDHISGKIEHFSSKVEQLERERLDHSHDPIFQRLENVSAKLAELENRPVNVSPGNSLMQRAESMTNQESAKNEPSAKENLRERLVRRITRNSKEYVKNVMLSMIIKYRRISGMQLRDIIVDEQGLASRSSFYRLLSELEEEGELDVVSDGKEKIYIAKISKSKTLP